MLASFALTSGASSASACDPAKRLGQIERLDADAGLLQQLLAVAHGIEGGRTSPQRADPSRAESAHDAAGGGEHLADPGRRRRCSDPSCAGWSA